MPYRMEYDRLTLCTTCPRKGISIRCSIVHSVIHNLDFFTSWIYYTFPVYGNPCTCYRTYLKANLKYLYNSIYVPYMSWLLTLFFVVFGFIKATIKHFLGKVTSYATITVIFVYAYRNYLRWNTVRCLQVVWQRIHPRC